MSRRGIAIVLSGAKGVYTSALSVVLADVLKWKWARFSDYIRDVAKAAGESELDTGALQRVGQQLVRDKTAEFVAGVLVKAGWTPGDDLVLDGLRHAEVFMELQRQMSDSTDVRVVHIEIQDRTDRADRVKRSEGSSDKDFEEYDKDETEKQVEETPAWATLRLNGVGPRGELAKTIISRLVPDFSPDKPHDAGENISAIEPMLVEESVESLAQELIKEAGAFAKEVPTGLAQPLASLVRAMNCYYSNKIEGHNAPLVDIELALSGDYEKDPDKRYLQAEAKAHIEVQRWIDEGGLENLPAASWRAISAIHDRFYSEFPDPQYVTSEDGSLRALVVPGSFRRDDLRVGDHHPPSSGALPRFMARFEDVYGRLDSSESLVRSIAAAHHRLLWIHPFGDGNGRVARLMSDTMLSRTLRTHSLWSVSRGLADHEAEYKRFLAACDEQRQGDLDGRGNLSERVLTSFSRFFLNVCLEQVRFMRKQMRLDEISNHIERWVETASVI